MLALLLSLCTATGSYAHGVPGSVLTFSRDGAQLSLTIRFALDDLLVAFSQAAPLHDIPADSALPDAQVAQLGAYFAEHIALHQGATALTLSLDQITLASVPHHDLGEYVVVQSRFTADLPDAGPVFPLSLYYDVIMHEVRNHSATVYWSENGAQPVNLTRFYYTMINRRTQPVILELPVQ